MPTIDPDCIIISHHARQRFEERWKGKPPECYEKELKRLLRKAVPEDLGHGLVARIITNGYQPAAYFTAEGWRFVLDVHHIKLLTCERPYLKKQRPKTKLYRKKQKL